MMFNFWKKNPKKEPPTPASVGNPAPETKQPVFEDLFMDIQAGFVSLTKEALRTVQKRADKYFIFIYDFHGTFSANVFFEVNGQIVQKEKLGWASQLFSDFNKFCMEDMFKLKEIGKKYNRPIPACFKMEYNALTNGFTADYIYDFLSYVDSSALFDAWLEEETNKRAR